MQTESYESKIRLLEAQLKAERESKMSMAGDMERLDKLVQSREEYMCQLENETVLLRNEIKQTKFNGEKSGYTGFLSGLTQLRCSEER